jgi:hypothetical protein
MRARTFFYVSAGMFLMAAAYSLLAGKVLGQGGVSLTAVSATGLVVADDGRVYSEEAQSYPRPWPFVHRSTIPTSSKIIGFNREIAIAENGDSFFEDGAGWHPNGNIFTNAGGPVVPGPIVGINDRSTTDICVVTQTGNVYMAEPGPHSFSWRGNPFTGTVASMPTTWTQMKLKYKNEE